MSFKTTIQPSNHSFPVEAHETILEAALEHGYVMPYSCRNGACGACKGKIVEGKVDYGDAQAYTLSEADKAVGLALFCCAKPLSDLVIESHEVSRAQDIPVKMLPCRVERMHKVADDVMVITDSAKGRQASCLLAGQCPA